MTTTASDIASTTTAPEPAPLALPVTDPSVNPKLFRGLAVAVGVLLVGIVLLRLSAYGIWDPWELSVADAARKLGEGAVSSERPASWSLRLVQASFAVFGTREWAGRLPLALCGLLLLASVGLWVRRYAGSRAALYAALALGTTPLFLLHSRQMVGATPAFLAAALVAIGACNALYAPSRANEPAYAPWAWLALALLGGLFGVFSAGALLTVVPSLGAVSAVALLSGTPFDRTIARERRSASWIVIAATTAVSIVVARTLWHHGSEYSVWTGGVPLDEAVPTYERVISQLFHGLAPWSAAAPVALGAALWTTAPTRADRPADSPADSRADGPLRLICVVWGALAYAAVTIYLSTYGAAAYPAAAAPIIVIALWLSDLEERTDSFWPEFTIVFLMVGLLIRDYALYPSSPFDGLGLVNVSAPDKFNPKGSWAVVLGLFGVTLLLSCMATRERAPLDLRAPYRGVRESWNRSVGHRGWLVVAALVWLGLVIFGAIAVIQPPGVRMTSIARRIGRAAGAVAFLLPVALALGQVVFHESRRLARARHLPLLVAALGVGIYASQVFLPKLSAHLSPREVFDVFEKLAGDKEPLAQHQVQGRAAAYYVRREVKDVNNEAELVTYLDAPSRRWALMPSERLPDIDVAFRRKTGRHLFVPNAENARVSLVSNLPVDKVTDENPLAKYVLRTPPTPQHRLGSNFEGKIELIGYDLELPQKDYVGAGQTFTVTWIFRATQGNLGHYQSFLHVDAEGQRINGDHDPVDGMYPVRLWNLGDIVVDRQRVSVPATTPPGTYTMYTGFFRGETRLKVLSGPKDDADRVLAGTIQIR
jgi:hypothetical protein